MSFIGSKISKNAVEGIKITIPDQCPYLCPYDQTPNLSNPDMRNMWEHFLEVNKFMLIFNFCKFVLVEFLNILAMNLIIVNGFF